MRIQWVVLQKQGRKKCECERPSNFVSGNYSKQRGDKRDSPSHITPIHALHLTFPQHVHDLVTLQDSPGCLEGEKAHPRLRQAFDKPMVFSMRLLRYFFCRNSQLSGMCPSALSSLNALG